MAKNIDSQLAHIDQRLKIWADWYLKIIRSGLGYASIPWDELMKSGYVIRSTAPKRLPVNETAEQMDAALTQLRQMSPELVQVLRIYYLMPGTIKQQARLANLSYTHFRWQVRTAKVWLVAWFQANQSSKLKAG